MFPTQWTRPASILALIPILYALQRLLRTKRTSKIAIQAERVLILGASSGVGRSIARQYAKRGAKVCLVGRRKTQIDEAAEECRAAAPGKDSVLALTADISVVEDMVRVRSALENDQEWRGLDTVILVAGVSALQPLMSVAGVEREGEHFTPASATVEGIQRTVTVANAALTGNYIGPLVAAVTLIPTLSRTSPSPSILLVSSLAALIPPPTRTLYGSTKSASLVLYQALSIEHPQIAFTFFLPSTIEGDFRASAVDGGKVREADPNKSGLKKEAVARRCIRAVDGGEKTVFMPGLMRFAHLLYWVWPAFVEWRARVKYNFTS